MKNSNNIISFFNEIIEKDIKSNYFIKLNNNDNNFLLVSDIFRFTSINYNILFFDYISNYAIRNNLIFFNPNIDILINNKYSYKNDNFLIQLKRTLIELCISETICNDDINLINMIIKYRQKNKINTKSFYNIVSQHKKNKRPLSKVILLIL